MEGEGKVGMMRRCGWVQSGSMEYIGSLLGCDGCRGKEEEVEVRVWVGCGGARVSVGRVMGKVESEKVCIGWE